MPKTRRAALSSRDSSRRRRSGRDTFRWCIRRASARSRVRRLRTGSATLVRDSSSSSSSFEADGRERHGGIRLATTSASCELWWERLERQRSQSRGCPLRKAARSRRYYCRHPSRRELEIRGGMQGDYRELPRYEHGRLASAGYDRATTSDRGLTWPRSRTARVLDSCLPTDASSLIRWRRRHSRERSELAAGAASHGRVRHSAACCRALVRLCRSLRIVRGRAYFHTSRSRSNARRRRAALEPCASSVVAEAIARHAD